MPNGRSVRERPPDPGAAAGAGAPSDSQPPRASRTPVDPERLAEASALRRAVIRLSRRPRDGFSHAKLNILGDLRTGGPLTAGELASLQRMQPQSLTRVLAELEAEGLISRKQDSIDRRRTILTITRAGTERLVRTMRQR